MSNWPPEPWRVLPYHVGSSVRHFALSDALVRHAREPTLWWHATDVPTLILGTGQRWDAPGAAACAARGVLVVRRQAGGTAVFAGPGVLGLDVALPADHPLALPDIVETYRWLGEVWCETARRLGAPASLVSVAEARAAAQEVSDNAGIVRLACFGSLSPYEVVVAGRKLVGLAQVRRRGAVLLQAGIHRHFDADGLADLLAPGTRRGAADGIAHALRSAAVGWEEATGTPLTESDIMAALQRELPARVGARLVPGTWSEAELAHAAVAERA